MWELYIRVLFQMKYLPESGRSGLSWDVKASELLVGTEHTDEFVWLTALGGIGGGTVDPWLRGDSSGREIFIDPFAPSNLLRKKKQLWIHYSQNDDCCEMRRKGAAVTIRAKRAIYRHSNWTSTLHLQNAFLYVQRRFRITKQNAT